MVAGEASADIHGANLVKAIKARRPSAVFSGIGGRRMEEAGVRLLYSSSEMAVVGLTEVFARLGAVFKAAQTLKRLLKKKRPALLILIDYPDFNLHIAGAAKRAGVPVLYYVSPQVWAWRSGRVRKIARRTDRVAVILPFEEAFYRERGVKVDYVGHPLMDSAPPFRKNGSTVREAGRPVVGLLPGSRREEVRNLLPTMAEAALLLKRRCPGMRFVLPLAPTIDVAFLRPWLKPQLEIEVVKDDVYGALKGCDAAVVASGTATLDTAIAGVPMVIVYRVSPISYLAARAVVKVDKIGLVNLVAGEKVFAELIQEEVRPSRVAGEVIKILEDEKTRNRMAERLVEVRAALGRGGAAERTARIALELMDGRNRKDL